MSGRPKRVFSEEEKRKIAEYALNNCNTLTIANALNIPFNTLTRHFGKLLKTKRAEHRVNLRQYQSELAKTTPAMAIFLGKNELEQTDKQQIEQIGEEKARLDAKQAAEARELAALRLRRYNTKGA